MWNSWVKILPSFISLLKKWENHQDFPGGPVVKTSPSNAGGVGSIPGRGAKFPHASQPKKRIIKQKQYCNKFNKDFKNGPHQKEKKEKKWENHKILSGARLKEKD